MTGENPQPAPAAEQTPPPAKQGCGCRTIVMVIGVLAILFTVLIVVGVAYLFFGLRAVEPYERSLEAVRAHPEIREQLGEPIEPGWLGSISYEVNSDGGGSFEADLPVSGPRGSAEVSVRAERVAGEWEYQRFCVRLDDSDETYDLTGELDSPP